MRICSKNSVCLVFNMLHAETPFTRNSQWLNDPMPFGASSGIRRPVHKRPLNGEAPKLQEQKVYSAQRNAARTSIDRERKATPEARKGASNSELPASLENNTVSLDRAEGARIRSGSSEGLSRSTSIFGQFYELSRVRVALAQLSAQKLQRSFAAFIGCRSPQEYFQLQNQLVKEQLELLVASIYGPFLNHAWQRSIV